MTKIFGVIGHPIGRSLSPLMHTAALRAMHMDAYYAPFDVPKPDLAVMLRALLLAGVEGLNVTVPLKEAVIPLLDRIDPTAQAIGAVNTIVIRRGRTIGYNTDGIGFTKALRELGWRPGGSPTVVLGAGGAARAVVWELSRRPRAVVMIANRDVPRAQRLARWLTRRRPRVSVQAMSFSRVQLERAELLINATSVGMQTNDRLPLNLSRLQRGTLVYDLVYHRQTRLVQEARRQGCVAANGTSMLLYQGVQSLYLWLKRSPPIDVMRRALERALGSGDGKQSFTNYQLLSGTGNW